MMRPLALIAATVVTLLPGLVLSHAGVKHEDSAVAVDTITVEKNNSPLPINVGGPFALTDHNGMSVTHETYTGKHMLVFFGYTNCQVMCSISLDRIGGALALLQKERPDTLAKLAPLVVTVDRENDTPANLKASLKKYHTSLIGLTGTSEELNQIYRAYNQSPSLLNVQMNDKDVVTHTSYFYLMGPDGNFQTLFPPILNSESMAGILKKYIQQPN